MTDVNLSLFCGDFLAVTGANGGGKTSLVKIMLGLLAPTAGRVSYYGGERVVPLNVGYLPQKSSLDMRFPITLGEMIASGFTGSAITDASVRGSRMKEVVDMMELLPLLDRQIGEVSGGQFQRALMARALLGKPDLLVLDEPTSYLDAYFEDRVFDILGELTGKCTIVMVSHAAERVRSVATRLVSVNRTVTEVPL